MRTSTPAKEWRRHPEVALVPMCAGVAELFAKDRREGVAAYLDTEARRLGATDWPELFRDSPRFPAKLDFGSPNLRAMNCGLGLHHPETRDEATAAWLRARQLERTVGFELEEPGARLYRRWSLLGRLVGLAAATAEDADPWGWHGNLGVYFRAWLALFWARFALSSIDTTWGPRSLATGARSQGAFDRLVDDRAGAIAFGRAWVSRKGIDAYWERGNEVRAYKALSALIWATAEPVREALAGELDAAAVARLLSRIPLWPTLATTWYLRTSRGLAVWLDRPEEGPDHDDVPNTNTPGIAAMGWDAAAGEVWSLPPPSRDHVRQKRVIESIEALEAGGQPWPLESPAPAVLRYRQGGAGRPLEESHALPGGELVYLVKHGAGGMTLVAPSIGGL